VLLVAHWGEIDMDGKVWTIPPARTEAAREHRVPLSDRALAILREMEAGRTGAFLFPGQRPGRPLSGMAFEMLLRRIGSAHGFRSSFRDWAGNETVTGVTSGFSGVTEGVTVTPHSAIVKAFASR
jgi:integrase